MTAPAPVFTPRDYQHDPIDFLCEGGSVGLFADMGLGKTSMTLEAISRLMLESFRVHKVLVVAPLRVALISWPDEIKKFGFDKRLTHTVIHGEHKKRRLHFDAHGTDITFINYDGLKFLAQNAVGMPHYDMLVLDESTFVKNPSTIRFQILRSLRRHVPRTLLLTGTPTPNSLLDIWAQIYMLDEGKRLGDSFYSFRNKYFMKSAKKYRWVLKKGSKEKIIALIADICMVMKAEDHIKMPELRKIPIHVELSPKRMAEYQDLEDDFFLMLEGGVEIEAFNAASLSMKLRQYIAGFVYDEDKKPIRVHEERLKVLKELIESLNGKPLLVAVQFQEEVAMIRDYFKNQNIPAIYGKTSTKLGIKHIRSWNAGELPMLLAHPASIGHGLNLQSGGCNMLWYSMTWSLEHFAQTIARLWRSGQEADAVMMHYILMKNTIDEAISSAVWGKDKTQAELIRKIKEWRDR